ncbi:MAG: cytochrome c biogenesis protein CcsA [Flavobacteriales bacterium]|nr:cytochrome c biogenesis protein CcsA [Flavobacteriales bacterium]
MSILILFFAFIIAFATFIENDFGRATAKALIFNTFWFELIIILLAYNLFNNILKYKLFRLEKIASLVFHLAFVFILIGAGITRYISFEGMMHIREGESTNLFISDDTFLQIHVDDKEHQYKYDKKLFLSGITNNDFSIDINFKDNDISIKSVEFLPNVKDSLFENIDGGKTILHLVVPGTNGMQDEFLKDGEQRVIKGEVFTFNNSKTAAINFTSKKEGILCNSAYSVSTMNMDTRETSQIDSLIDFTFNKRTLHTTNSLNIVLKNVLENAKQKAVSTSNVMVDGMQDALIVKIIANGLQKEVVLYGGKGYKASKQVFSLGNLNFKLSYGGKYYSTPFMVKLRDFQLDRYPGSMSPSSYAAEISILDNGTETPHRIYMNNVLQYKGFRLFQSSYDKDEKGTILSVNHDYWGTLITYIGYFLLALGFVLVFVTNKTRYRFLTNKLKKLSATLIFPLIFSTSCFAVDVIDANHIKNFDALVVQDNNGRFKPVHTLTSEYLRKIYGKNSFDGQTPTQVIVGMMYNPISWSKENLIRITHPDLRTLLNNTDLDSKYIRVSFNNFFDENGHYLLVNLVEQAYKKLPKDRGQLDKDVIKVDERVNVCFTIFSSSIFRFFPLPNDSNNSWLPHTSSGNFSGNDSLFVANIMPMYFSGVKEGIKNNNWAVADSVVEYIHKFQLRYATDILPDQSKIDLEITYNKLALFSKLFLYYFLLGILLIIIIIIQLFNDTKVVGTIVNVLKWLIILGFLAHSSALVMRWVISGHAPWSNGYESMVYIAWATILSGLIYTKRSVLTLAATAVVSALLLMVAHLNWLDPEITNLVPVLKSYWLMIHVAIITASYGFLVLGAILGIISLWIIIFTNAGNKNKLKNTLGELTIINEKTIEVGLFMLTIGTFLGGVWANESWGRYWGWDPKETWALVSVLVYVFVLHMRFIPTLKSKLVFNTVSMFAIWTIIMTYFGVNYYLSGLHSYAAGDPMPIPSFVYYLFVIMIITAILSKLKYKKHY